jgi:hypothetical protein
MRRADRPQPSVPLIIISNLQSKIAPTPPERAADALSLDGPEVGRTIDQR